MVDEPLTDWTRWCRPGRLYVLVVRAGHEDLPQHQIVPRDVVGRVVR
jgi:hypothetical protein